MISLETQIVKNRHVSLDKNYLNSTTSVTISLAEVSDWCDKQKNREENNNPKYDLFQGYSCFHSVSMEDNIVETEKCFNEITKTSNYLPPKDFLETTTKN